MEPGEVFEHVGGQALQLQMVLAGQRSEDRVWSGALRLEKEEDPVGEGLEES